MTVPEMIKFCFTSTLLKAGTHYRVGVQAAFFPVFSETLLILNLPCQHVFVGTRTDSVRQSLLADGAGNPDIGVPKRRGQETNHGAYGDYAGPEVHLVESSWNLSHSLTAGELQRLTMVLKPLASRSWRAIVADCGSAYGPT